MIFALLLPLTQLVCKEEPVMFAQQPLLYDQSKLSVMLQEPSAQHFSALVLLIGILNFKYH